MRSRWAALTIAGVLGCGGGASTGGGGSASTTTTTTTTTTTDGGGGGIPAGCIPSENVGAIADTCGVFVSSSLGDDGNTGSQGKPLKSISAAITLAQSQGKPVYACGELFDAEAVSIAADATLYGALDCANGWVYAAAKKTQLAPSADAIALVISKDTTSVEVFDFAITSANAEQPGGSSIAVLVAQAAANFTRCELTAGNGHAGAPGEPYAQSDTAAPGTPGQPGGEACDAVASLGGLPVTSTCDASSTSGLGGSGTANKGGPGDYGSPLGASNGGAGEDTAVCEDGDPGDPGAPGDPGTGAKGTGSIGASGYTGVSGGNGTAGHVAQAGGGGGGAKGGDACPGATKGGASGGSGGSGGCGGLAGKGGAFGGASIALVSIDATLSFTGVALKAGNGGNGGDGGDGQKGGAGGTPGVGGSVPMNVTLNAGCAGGAGGVGGQGGKGGGGLGGASIALAMTGKVVPMTGLTATKGAAGEGGKGDNANDNVGDGAKGLAVECWDFSKGAACK